MFIQDRKIENLSDYYAGLGTGKYEADDLLSLGTNKSQGFLEQTRELLQLLPASSQIALFSATMPQPILDLTKHFMDSPLEFLKPKSHLTLEGIKQFYTVF